MSKFKLKYSKKMEKEYQTRESGVMKNVLNKFGFMLVPLRKHDPAAAPTACLRLTRRPCQRVTENKEQSARYMANMNACRESGTGVEMTHICQGLFYSIAGKKNLELASISDNI